MKKKKLAKILAVALIGSTMSLAVACNQPAKKKVYFDVIIDGETVSVEKNGLLDEPLPLEDYSSGDYLYVFEGWEFTDESGTTRLWDFETDKVLGNVELTPKFSKQEISLAVVFKNGETVISQTTVNKSSGIVSAPENFNLTYDDVQANKRYTFEYWYVLENNEEKEWDFDTDKVTKDNTVIYAKYSSLPITVTVTMNGEPVTVNYGEKLTKPQTDPTKDADDYTYEFVGWEYTVGEETKLWDFENDKVEEAVALTPKFEKHEIELAVTFVNGDTVISQTTVNKSSGVASEPEFDLTYTDENNTYTFDHWYVIDDGVEREWNFATDKVTKDNTVIYAKYTSAPIILNVVFKNGETVIAQTTVNKSSGIISAPEDFDLTYDDVQANKRYMFEYWYVLENDEEKEWDFATDKVTKDNTVIYAKYSSLPITVTVTINGESVTVNYGEKLTKPQTDPTKDADDYTYEFVGWEYTVGEETKLWDFENDKVEEAVALTPKFEKHEIKLAVTFKNGDAVISQTTVNKSSGIVAEPDFDLTYDDVDANKRYTFEYWYVIKGGSEKKWNFASDKVTKDNTVIYAKYSSLPISVTVTLNGEPVTVDYGGKLTKPETNPTKEADGAYTYEFKFWMCNGTMFDFNTVITQPIVVEPYFKKTARLYNISIDLDNGTVVEREGVSYGVLLSDYVTVSIIKESTIDTDYTFSHFVDADGNTTTTVNGSLSYKAIYTESVRKYDITINGKTESVEYGTNLLEYMGEPTKDEDDDGIYTFSHWVDSSNKVVGADAIVSGNGTYTAVYDVEYKRYTITFVVAGKITSQKINVGESIIDYLPTDTHKPADAVNGIMYTFSHFEDSKGNEVTADTKVVGEETFTAIYDEKEYGGTMSISDIVATKECGRYIPVIFSKKGFSVPVTYSFEGNDISISKDGFITVNNVGKTVTVTAKNEEIGMEDTFTVTTYDKLYDYTSTFGTKYAINNNFASKFANHKTGIEAKLDKETPSIVFMGDSFFDTNPTAFWTDFYTKYFPGKNAYSFGVSGSRSDEVSAWVSAVVPYAPKSLVIHVGTNDIYDLNKDGNRTAQDIVDMLATVHNALPNTHVYYISVEYRSSKKAGNVYEDISNAAAKAYCDNTDKVTYLDSLPYFTTTGVSSGGEIDTNKFRDGIHIKLENYTVYTDLLEEAGVNFDDYAIKLKNPIQQACGIGTVTLDGDTLTINNVNGGTNRTRAYLYDTENQKYIQGNVAVWGTLNMKDIVVANNQFAEILLTESPNDSWASANNVDVVVRKHAKANVVKSIVWGAGVGGENSTYKWADNDYSIDFSLVVKNKKAYITLDGETKVVELQSESMYIGFGAENLNYTITGFNVSTDENLITSKIPENVVVNDVEDFSVTDNNLAKAQRSGGLVAGINAVAGEFVLEGKLDIISTTLANNPHAEFRMNGNDNNRFLLWDKEKKGKFKVSAIVAGKQTCDDASGNDLIYFTAGTTITLTWKIVVYNGDYYFYIDDELRLVNKTGDAVSSINLGMQAGTVKFYGIKAYIKSKDPTGFNTQITKIQSDITACASLAKGVTRV